MAAPRGVFETITKVTHVLITYEEKLEGADVPVCHFATIHKSLVMWNGSEMAGSKLAPLLTPLLEEGLSQRGEGLLSPV